jgi:hypothetical protein
MVNDKLIPCVSAVNITSFLQNKFLITSLQIPKQHKHILVVVVVVVVAGESITRNVIYTNMKS